MSWLPRWLHTVADVSGWPEHVEMGGGRRFATWEVVMFLREELPGDRDAARAYEIARQLPMVGSDQWELLGHEVLVLVASRLRAIGARPFAEEPTGR